MKELSNFTIHKTGTVKKTHNTAGNQMHDYL